MAAVVAVGLVCSVPAVAGQEKDPPVEQGPSNTFGRVMMPPHPEFTGRAVEIEARIVLHNGSGARDPAHLMLAFNVHTDTVLLTFVGVETEDGRSIRLAQDQREADVLQPKVFVAGQDLPPAGQPIVLRATVEATNDGRHHVGAMAIAFDEDWMKMTTANGYSAEVYWFSELGSHGVSPGGLAPPFEGSGNVVPWAGPAMAVTVGCAVALWRRSR
jgi:hypothetical protein